MSTQFGKLCSVILLEHFGEIIQKVANDLYQWGTKPLRLVVASTRLPLSKVKQALRILIQYGFVTYAPNIRKSVAEYTLVSKNIVLLLRYPRYLLFIKTHYGDEAERLVEELLRTGQDNASRIITRAAANLKEHSQCEDVDFTKLYDKFSLLVIKQFIMRCPSPVEDAEVPVFNGKEQELFLPPDLNKKTIGELQKGQHENAGDGSIYWRVNFDKFHQEFRDQVMIEAITRRIDDNAGKLMHHLLAQMYLRTEPWAATSNPIPHTEIKDAVRKLDSHPQLLQYLDQYLKILDEDSSNFVNKVGDSGGGQYSLNIKEAFTQLAWTAIENVVLERFGSKSARIFRLVKAKKFVDQEQIQQIAMIPAKEAKLLTYQLLQENFLQVQELRKALPSNAPSKTFFLFHIDLNQVSRMVLEICYQCLYNTMIRRDHEKNENRRLIEKQQRIASITQNMREQGASAEQLAEIEEMLTPPELNLVGKVQTMLNRLSLAELQMDETMLILQLYLTY